MTRKMLDSFIKIIYSKARC